MARSGGTAHRRLPVADVSPQSFPDLEDAQVVRIERGPRQILLTLQLRASPRRARVRLRGLRSESVFHWIGSGVAGDDPDPSLPLDFIQTWSHEGDTLNLQGTLRGDAWYEWEISAARIDWDISGPAGDFAQERLVDGDEA